MKRRRIAAALISLVCAVNITAGNGTAVLAQDIENDIHYIEADRQIITADDILSVPDVEAGTTEPLLTLETMYGTLQADKDYIVTYSNEGFVGKASAHVEFTNDFYGEFDINYRVVPAAPVIKEIRVDDKSAVLIWDQASGAESYEVFMLDGESKQLITTAYETSVTVGELEPGKNYTFILRSCAKEYDEEFYSKFSDKVIVNTHPSVVANLRAENVKEKSAVLSWNPTAGAEGYIIYMRKDGAWTRVSKTDNTNTSYLVDFLNPGMSYQFGVKAYRTVNGHECNSLNVTTVNFATGGAVRNIRTASTSRNTIKLAWDKKSGSTGYTVYIQSGNTWKQLGKTKGTSWTISNLNAGTDYSFAVKGYKTVNGKNVNDKYYARLSASTNPSDVTNFKVSSVSDNSAKLIWDKVKGAQGYIVYLRRNNTWVRIYKGVNNYLDLKRLGSAITYQYAVKAYKTVNGHECNSLSFPTAYVTTRPGIVTNLKAETVSNNSVKLSWSKLPRTEGYIVYRYDYSKKSWIRLAKTKALNYTVSKLSSGTKYTFAVRGYNTVNRSELGASGYAKTDAVTNLDVVTQFNAEYLESNEIELTWTPVSYAEGYIIYQYDFNQKSWSRIKKDNLKNSYTVSDCQKGTEYRFAIKPYMTVNGRENLSVGYTDTYVIPDKLSNVTDFKAAATATGSIRFTWNKVTGAHGYRIIYSEQDSSNVKSNYYSASDMTNGGQAVISGLTVGKTYCFSIQACEKYAGKEICSAKTTVKTSTLPAMVSVNYNHVGNKTYLKWKSVSGASDYLVYLRVNNGSWQRFSAIGTSFTLNVPTNKPFYIIVKARKFLDGKEYCSEYQIKYFDNINKASLYVDGDSIAYGAGSHGFSYGELLARQKHLMLTKPAKSGATLSCNQNGRNHIPESVLKNANKKYDYAIIDGGVNDYFQNSSPGKVTAKGNTKFDKNTVCGGLETIFYHFRTKYPDTKLYFLSAHNILDIKNKKNSIGYTYNDYVNRIAEVCRKYNVQIIDCYNQSGFNTSNESLKKQYTRNNNEVNPNGDGVHPNLSGYKKFYMPVIYKTVKF